jgi:hypothetical protein
MKFKHPNIVLWDEVNIFSPGNSPFKFPSELPSQISAMAKENNQYANNLWLTAISTNLSAEMAPMFFLLFFSLDY